jgi:rhomboid protease GluP
MRILPPGASVTVTTVLIALNVAIFGLMLLQGVHPMQPAVDDLIRWGANYGPKTTRGQWWRLGTCMFLHIGLIHLLFNMVALWNVGALMERLLGRTGFCVLYAFAGVLSSIASVLWHPTVVSAGASGAIFGVYGGLLAFLVRHRDMPYHDFLAPLRTNTLAFLGYNLVFGFLQQGIDMAAHLGGLVGGFACGLVLAPPLPLRSRARQRLRSGCVGVLGLALLWWLTTSLPQAEDVESQFQQFAALDTATLTAFNGAITGLQQGRTTEAEVIRLITQDILPPWQEQRAVFQQLATRSRLTARQHKFVTMFLDYMSARQEGWELLHTGLRLHDVELFKQAAAKQRQADALLRHAPTTGERP